MSRCECPRKAAYLIAANDVDAVSTVEPDQVFGDLGGVELREQVDVAADERDIDLKLGQDAATSMPMKPPPTTTASRVPSRPRRGSQSRHRGCAG